MLGKQYREPILNVRGIFLKGVGLESFWKDALLMLGWGVTVLMLATMRSKKTLT